MWAEHTLTDRTRGLGPFARKLGGGLDQAASELLEPHAPHDLSAVVVIARMWWRDRRPVDEGIREAEVPGTERIDVSGQGVGATDSETQIPERSPR
jgi:hypothetical protein